MLETSSFPENIAMFPGLTQRIYYQNPETKEYWFHATSVCESLGFTNVTSAISLHCDEDEKIQEIWNGKATWFVSEAGVYGLAMGSKTVQAKEFKRWLKHDVLPKLREKAYYVMPEATIEQRRELYRELKDKLEYTKRDNQTLLEENAHCESIYNTLSDIYQKAKSSVIRYCNYDYAKAQKILDGSYWKKNAQLDFDPDEDE